MNTSIHERFGERLTGAIVLAAIVFAILFLAGGPDPTTADATAYYPPLVTAPGNPSWDF